MVVLELVVLVGQQQRLHCRDGKQAVGQQREQHMDADPGGKVFAVGYGRIEQQGQQQSQCRCWKQQDQQAVNGFSDTAGQHDQVDHEQDQHAHRPQGQVDARAAKDQFVGHQAMAQQAQASRQQ